MKKAYQKQRQQRTKRSKRAADSESQGSGVVQLTLDRSDVLREMQEGLH